jgi:ferredoxin-NADP reductase
MDTVFHFLKRFIPREYYGKVLYKSKLNHDTQKLIILPIEKRKSDSLQEQISSVAEIEENKEQDNSSNNTKKEFINTEKRGRFMFYPGQWMDFIPKDDKSAATGFSMTNSPNSPYLFHENELHFAIKLTNHKITKYIHSDDCKVGELIDMYGPEGKFVYVQPKKQIPLGKNPLTKVNLIAGGIGITPLCSIWNSVYYKTQVLPSTEVKLLYSAKQIEDFIFVDHFIESSRKNTKCPMHVHFNASNMTETDLEGENQKIIANKMDQNLTFGSINEALLKRVFFSDSSANENMKWGLFYICGPQPMIEQLSRMLINMGVAMEHIIYESWWQKDSYILY